MKIVRIQVKTKQHEDVVTEIDEKTLLVKTTALPIDGKANKAICKLVAKHFGVLKNQVSLKSGSKSKTKVLTID